MLDTVKMCCTKGALRLGCSSIARARSTKLILLYFHKVIVFFSREPFGQLYICLIYSISIDIVELLYCYGLLLDCLGMLRYVVEIVCFTIVYLLSIVLVWF